MFRLLSDLIRLLILGLIWLIVLGCAAWAAGALYFDLPFEDVRFSAAIGFLGLITLFCCFAHGVLAKWGTVLVGFGAVLAWWLTLQPRNDRAWQSDVAELASAKIDGDVITISNVRNFIYQSETVYTPRWETRTYRLSSLQGIDIGINYWGSPDMAHPLVSFQFSDAPPLCFSIEMRKELNEGYSAIGGLYRQYELIYIVADERDVMRVRTNYRKGEDIYLYRLRVTPEQARQRLMDYLNALNELRDHPKWYNAATTNCTTSIRTQHAAEDRAPWDWRMLLNGRMDELLYERHGLVDEGKDFATLEKQARINEAAKAADNAPDFSRRIRQGRVGFQP